MDNFAEYLSSLPHTPLTETVSSLYEAVYLPNGQPERLESTRYILVCRDIGLNRNERMNQIYDNALAECDRLNRMRSDEFLAEIGKSASEVRSPMTREEALDYLNCIKRGASDCKILKSTPSMLAYVPRKNKYGDLPLSVKLCMIKPVQFTGLTSEIDPEWSIDPNKRADNRYRRWKRAELGLPYAKDFKSMREKKPNEYQFNISKPGNDFSNYANFAVNAATSDTLMFPDRPNEIEQWVDEKRKNGQSTDINTYENNLYESVHTSRAKKVNDYLLKCMNQINRWLGSMEDSGTFEYESLLNPAEDLILVLIFHKPAYSGGGWYDEEERTVNVGVGPVLRAAEYYNANDLTEQQREMMVTLAQKIDANSQPTMTFSGAELDCIKMALNSDIFKQTIRHELTHHMQNLDTGYDQSTFDFQAQLRKLGLDERLAAEKVDYHDIYPWEIDAGIHERILNIIKESDWDINPTALAKYIFNIMMKESRQHGINDPDLTKQCWETAASLTRAVFLAKKSGKYTSAEDILRHIDDYAA